MGWLARKAEVYTIRSASIHSQPKLVPEDFKEFGMDLELLEKFYRRIEALSGFKHLDFEGVWDPDTKEPVLILVLARERAPRIKTIKRAIEVFKEELQLEETETEKWYVEDSDDWDESHFPESFDPPPRFT